jgi:adenosine deaminase
MGATRPAVLFSVAGLDGAMASHPKAELHLHVEGTLEPTMALRLAARNGVTLRHRDVEALSASYDFRDLQSFLDLYYECMAVLRTAADFEELLAAYLARAAADGVTRTEIFFDPQAHTSRNVPLAVVMQGLLAAIDDQDEVSVGLIPCFVRHLPVSDALASLHELEAWSDVLLGVGLDSAEVGHPPAAFAEVFETARSWGLHTVAHAGEEGPPAYVWEALDVLGVERVDHGIRCVEDDTLLARLAADGVPLTVCPLSNVRLRCVENLAAHPLPRLLEAGLTVALASDDPAYFGGYVGANYDAVQAAYSWSDADMGRLAAMSLDAAFIG